MHKRVVIHWLDIQTDHGWEDSSVLLTPERCETIGFVVSDTPECVMLASTVSGDGQTNCRTCIPRGCIERIDEL